MGKTMSKRASEFLEGIKKEHGNLIPFALFRKIMIERLGADEKRTIVPYLKLMVELNLIKEENDRIIILK